MNVEVGRIRNGFLISAELLPSLLPRCHVEEQKQKEAAGFCLPGESAQDHRESGAGQRQAVPVARQVYGRVRLVSLGILWPLKTFKDTGNLQHRI